MDDALTIGVRSEPDCAIATVAGEIDIFTVTRLRERLVELAASSRHLVIDLDQVTFIDSAGLAQRTGRHGQPRCRARQQPACGLRPTEDPQSVPPERARPPATAGPHR